jgi:hypothetical protein
MADQAAAFAGYAAQALVAAGQHRIKTKPVDGLTLQADERAAASVLPTVPATVGKKLAKEDAAFTVAEVAGLLAVVAESLPGAEPKQQLVQLTIAKKLADGLRASIAAASRPARVPESGPTARLYQIKVTLKDTRPPVWRRIRARDCTLDKLHEHIQTAMGWENGHLHHFRAGEQYFGDPDLLAATFEELGYDDSTAMKLSALMPAGGRKFKLTYEYDFGDSWLHELVVEKVGPPEAGAKYPVCVDGEWACPPEDVGGAWGYAEFLDAIRDPDHEQYEEMTEWVGGRFDPDEFDPATATQRMWKGLPDWRRA